MTEGVYEPGQDDLEDDGVLDSADSLVDRGVADVLDEGYVAPEGWSPGEGFGTTLAEERQGESLDQRLAQEVPDQTDEDPQEFADGIGDERAGRLVAPDEGSHPDVDSGCWRPTSASTGRGPAPRRPRSTSSTTRTDRPGARATGVPGSALDGGPGGQADQVPSVVLRLVERVVG